MPRSSRIVLPDTPHHVTQRGNRQQDIFHSETDRAQYKELLIEACVRHETLCLGWCLMTNHVHLILQPATSDGLRAVLASVHTAYTQRLNIRLGLSGHVFQGRFASYPMDVRHLMAALRYVENNPVKAGLVASAEDWRWSSARARVFRQSDGLTHFGEVDAAYPDWKTVLEQGYEMSQVDESIEAALRSGIPQGEEQGVGSAFGRLGLRERSTRRGRPNKGDSPLYSPQ